MIQIVYIPSHSGTIHLEVVHKLLNSFVKLLQKKIACAYFKSDYNHSKRYFKSSKFIFICRLFSLNSLKNVAYLLQRT
ncbi:Hypothetical protein WP0143 [Wolbachia endosymbiont of Culex quinquefasciatus Pel]|nr:Hypothetical protein WP0143 [Wolbachia endosymbiont of Culex quinquefasciatus Pel]